MCDGCGQVFDADLASARVGLQAELARRRRALVVTLLVALAIGGVIAYLAIRGWIYISVPVMLGVVGSIGRAVHRISVVRGHLRELDRRHVPLPTATLQGPR